ncbi:MAG: hypothetical protein LBP32_06810, partial [Spirochaetaceae bacterium]|nr:hypothetical protein [Spirochaetaceae bacterium]
MVGWAARKREWEIETRMILMGVLLKKGMIALIFAAAALAPLWGEGLPPEYESGEEQEAGPVLPQRPQRLTHYAMPSRFTSHGEQDPFITIPGLDRELTIRYIRQYSSPGGLSWLGAVMERGAPYLAFIRREIQARNLPPELIYLPVIESAYLPTAVSRSG